jgi:hypothetical protein
MKSCEQYELVAGNVTGQLYTDKTQEQEDLHQNVLIAHLKDQEKHVALYVGSQIKACGMLCHTTQITNIFICKAGTIPQGMKTNDKVAEELSSQAFLHLQIHSDQSISHQLYMACKYRRGTLQIVISRIYNFRTVSTRLPARYNKCAARRNRHFNPVQPDPSTTNTKFLSLLRRATCPHI